MSQALSAANTLEAAVEPRHAPTMGALQKLRYTHTDAIDFIIANPGISQNAVAARYGFSPGWLRNVMASDAWQSAMAARRAEMIDPTLAATIEERFRGVTILSLERLHQKLSAPQVSDNVVLKAVELGARSLGLGTTPPPPPNQDHLAQLANRLIDLQSRIRGDAANLVEGATYENDDAKAA